MKKSWTGWVGLVLVAGTASAAAPGDLLARFEAQARDSDTGFAASVDRGREWFEARHGGDWSCSTCHTRDPGGVGRHTVTGKSIDPMAPAVNPQRLSSERTVEKWFRRNCKDVLGRECSPAEKADVVAFLMSVGR